MFIKESASCLSGCLVACNIYVSAGHSRWAPLLINLLEDAQQECKRLRRSTSQSLASAPLALVHAFADGPYDRSSFHVAGSSTLVAQLASHISVKAATSLSSLRRQTESSGDAVSDVSTAHPMVGLVDHVAVLPLSHEANGNISGVALETWNEELRRSVHCDLSFGTVSDECPTKPLTTPTGLVARTIGTTLEQIGVQVLWYGYADIDQTPLAQVRRHKTRFFEGLPSSSPSSLGQATVGAPPYFVENYNIQVATRDKKQAQSLTKWLRSRDGGLPFVEALTLPYGYSEDENDNPVPLYEVACNLLNPTVSNTQIIDSHVEAWKAQSGTGTAVEIRRSYRVGTTADMCLKVLQQTNTSTGEEEHNRSIRDALENYLK